MATPNIISRTSWPAFLTLRQVMDELGVDREHIFWLATTQHFPLVKQGRTYRIPCKAFVRWLVNEAELAHPEEERPTERPPEKVMAR